LLSFWKVWGFGHARYPRHTRKAHNAMNAGETLRVIAIDHGAAEDISTFCQQTGNNLLASDAEGNEHVFLIRKSSACQPVDR
jgi:tRNA 2-thiouridine synthesizing protein A